MPTPESEAIRRERVLGERARRLGRPVAPRGAANDVDLLVFDLAREHYAFETRYVRDVFTLEELTPVPCTPPHVLGIVNLRGEIVAVIELKRLLGLPERGLTNATRAVVLREGAIEFGVVADAVVGVRAVPAAAILPAPATLAGINAEFLRGVTGEGLIVFDAARVIAHPAMIVDDEVDEPGPDRDRRPNLDPST